MSTRTSGRIKSQAIFQSRPSARWSAGRRDVAATVLARCPMPGMAAIATLLHCRRHCRGLHRAGGVGQEDAPSSGAGYTRAATLDRLLGAVKTTMHDVYR